MRWSLYLMNIWYRLLLLSEIRWFFHDWSSLQIILIGNLHLLSIIISRKALINLLILMKTPNKPLLLYPHTLTILPILIGCKKQLIRSWSTVRITGQCFTWIFLMFHHLLIMLLFSLDFDVLIAASFYRWVLVLIFNWLIGW